MTAVGASGLLLGAIVLAGVSLPRAAGLSWTWAFFAMPFALALLALNLTIGAVALFCVVSTVWLGAKLHFRDVTRGGEDAIRAAARRGPLEWLRARERSRPLRDGVLVDADSLIVGVDDLDDPVRIPFGRSTGRHSFIVGKTGSGKTVTQAYLAKQHILAGKGAIVVDPKGDDLMRDVLQESAAAAGKAFYEWSPEGPCYFNPYKHGNPTEVTHKALAAETYTEPHYLRQAQRYLGWQIRTMKKAGLWPVTPDALVTHMYPPALKGLGAKLSKSDSAKLMEYLGSLDDRQVRELGGTRDRLAILAESDIGPWLSPRADARELDLRNIVLAGDVAYIQLESDRYEEAAKMIGAAIVQDLITIIAHLQKSGPRETLISIDEFAAVAAAKVTSLFARGRSAGFSLVLGTQSLADLDSANALGETALLDQVVDNVSTLIVHQQIKPDSVETLAKIAGTTYAWTTTMRTRQTVVPLSTGEGTRTRAREFVVHPDDIKGLNVAEAIVIVPGDDQRPRRTHMFHPERVSVQQISSESLSAPPTTADAARFGVKRLFGALLRDLKATP